MSALKNFFNLIFGKKTEVKKKRKLSKPSEKPKAVYDLLNGFGAIRDINSTHGTEFSSEWVKDKNTWRKFFYKNRVYLISLKESYYSIGWKYNPDAIIQAPSIENEIKEKAEKDLGFEVTVNHGPAGVYTINPKIGAYGTFGSLENISGGIINNNQTGACIVNSPNELPMLDGLSLITESSRLVKDGFEEAGKVDEGVFDKVIEKRKEFEQKFCENMESSLVIPQFPPDRIV